MIFKKNCSFIAQYHTATCVESRGFIFFHNLYRVPGKCLNTSACILYTRCIRLFIFPGETIIDLLYTIYIDIQGNLKKFDMLFDWEKVLFSIHVDLLDQD